MTRPRSRRLKILALCAAGWTLAGAPVSADNISASSEITIAVVQGQIVSAFPNDVDHGDHFEGNVDSNVGTCKPNRTIKVFRKRSGNDKLLGTATTNGNGQWQLASEDPGNKTFYAKVLERDLDPSPEHRHACLGDKSPPVKVADDDPNEN